MDINYKDLSTRRPRPFKWISLVCSIVVGSVILGAIIALAIFTVKAKLKLPGHYLVRSTHGGETISTTHLLQHLWPDYEEGRDKGELDVIHKHSSTFGVFYVNNTPVTMTKFSVFFHTSANGQQALHEVMYGLLDRALGLNMTSVQGVVLDVMEVYNRNLFRGSSIAGLFNLFRQAVMWITTDGSFAVGARMPYVANLTKMPLNYTITGMPFVSSAARLLVLDALTGQHDRPQKNCYLDTSLSRVVALDNGATFDHKGFKYLDLQPSLLQGPRANPGGCLVNLDNPRQMLPGQSMPANCLMVQQAVSLLSAVDVDKFAANFAASMMQDELLQWYRGVWKRYYRAEGSHWGPCLERVVGQAVVTFYEKRVQAQYPLPPGDVCGVDIAAFWSNILRVRIGQFLEAGRADVKSCALGHRVLKEGDRKRQAHRSHHQRKLRASLGHVPAP